jgi:hypothetical protein
VKWIRCTQPLFRLAGLNTRGGKRRELFIFYSNLNALTPRQSPSVEYKTALQLREYIPLLGLYQNGNTWEFHII